MASPSGSALAPHLKSFVTPDSPTPSFDRAAFRHTLQHSPYNYDERIEAFRPSALIVAGRKRKGSTGPWIPAATLRAHLLCDRGPFPLEASTPLPTETVAASCFSRDMSPVRAVRLRGVRLNSLERKISDCILSRSNWGGCIPPAPRPAAGKFRTVAIKHLSEQHGLGVAFAGEVGHRLSDRWGDIAVSCYASPTMRRRLAEFRADSYTKHLPGASGKII